MTVREFIHANPGEPLDLTMPEGRMLLEPRQVVGLLGGGVMIAMPDDPRKAAYVQAEDLLERTVCSAYSTRGLWRLAVSYDPLEREIPQNCTEMMRWRRL